MPVTNCMLVRRELAPPGDPAGVLMALHGHGGGVDQLQPLCCAVNQSLSVVLPLAWRTLHLHGMVESEDPGHSWFFNFDDGSPEPATFGDCLMELEALVYDIREQYSASVPIFVLGIDQGAVLALGLCGVVPDYLAGVAAIGGYLPKIKGWTPPYEDFANMPLLLIRDEANAQGSSSLLQHELEQRNARVTLSDVSGALQAPLLAGASLRRWLAPLLRPQPARVSGQDCAVVED
jgi:phospholipase/carboxylesterase